MGSPAWVAGDRLRGGGKGGRRYKPRQESVGPEVVQAGWVAACATGKPVEATPEVMATPNGHARVTLRVAVAVGRGWESTPLTLTLTLTLI